MPSKRQSSDKDAVLMDFHALATLYASGKVKPSEVVNINLPSGRFLHNPAKKTVKDASRWATQQVDNAKAASSDWLDGVMHPSRDPIAAGIAAAGKWEDKVKKAITDKRFEKGLRKSSLSEIQQIATAVGTGGYETGVEARRQKVQRVVQELQPLVQAASDSIQAIPDTTDADRIKRLTEARRLMIEVGKRRAG